MTKKRAVVLLSGGLDSTTVLAIAKSEGFEVHALSFDYGQRHALELSAAQRLADVSGVDHKIVNVQIPGTSCLHATGARAPVPIGRSAEEMANGIPVSYVPARNTVFLSFAVAWAEVLESSDVFIGVNALDYSGYPDCRPEYVEAYERMANLATKRGVEGSPLKIHAPLMYLNKAQIIARGLELGVDYSQTSSCYDPSTYGACGECDSCTLRLKGFAELGIADPVRYRSRKAS